MLILASASPRRSELLKKMGIEFAAIPSVFGEENRDNLPPIEYALFCAEGKAAEVYGRAGGTVLGADTIVVIDDRILGKPKNAKDAKEMLRQVCGREHTVISAICLIKNGERLTAYDKTELFINNLTDDEIDEYVAGGSPLDKAGAYGLQDDVIKGKVRYIKGSRDNVVGLPTEMLERMIDILL